MVVRFVFFFLSVVACSSNLFGQLVVQDQFFPGSNAGVSSVLDFLQRAQSFPIGTDGVLESVDVYVNGDELTTSPLFWEIRPVINGVPSLSDESILASGSFLENEIPIFPDLPPLKLDLSSFGIAVSAGEEFAVTLRVDEGRFGWRTNFGVNPGTKFQRNPQSSAPWEVGTFSPQRAHGFATYIRSAPEFYGVQSGNTTNGNPFYLLDEGAGTGQQIAGLQDLVFANAMASRDSQSLFTIAADRNDGFARKLVKIDPSSGSPVITVGPALDTGGGAFSTHIDALAYHDSHGLLGIDLNDMLVQINIQTGQMNLIGRVGELGRPIGVNGLAFSPNGELFGWGVERHGLLNINPDTAAYTIIGGGSSSNIQALEFSPEGQLYGARDLLFSIDVNNGSRSAIGSGAGFDDLRGIAFATGTPIPEPVPLMGDCNLDGVVNFLDIAPMIGFLATGGYLEEADINESGEVTFLDVAPFIAILFAR